MRMKKLCLLCLLTLNAILTLTAANKFWIGINGGGDGMTWTDPLNWSGGVPTANDRAYFENIKDTIVGEGIIEVGQIIVRNSPDDGSNTTAITFNMNGTLKTSANFNTTTLLVLLNARLTLANGAFEISGARAMGTSLGGHLLIESGVHVQVIHIAGNTLDGVSTAGATATYEKSTITNAGTITIGPGFTNGCNVRGNLFNVAGGKIIIEQSNVLANKGTGLTVNGGALSNEDIIWVKGGFATGISTKGNGTLTNSPCAVISSTNGIGDRGFVYFSGGVVINEGIIISNTNGPICSEGATDVDATFIIIGPNGETLNYTINGGATQNLVFDGTDQKITVTNPTTTSILNLVSSANCPSLAIPASEIPLLPSNTILSLTITTPEIIDTCGKTVDLTSLAFGSPIGGAYTYFPTAIDADLGANPISANDLNQISESRRIHVKYAFAGGCSIIKSISVTMTNTPTLEIVEPEAVCAGNTVNAIGHVIGKPSGGTLTYHASLADALNELNTLPETPLTTVSTSQKIYARYEIGPCTTIDSIQVNIHDAAPSLTINQPETVSTGTIVDVTAAGIALGRPMGGYFTYYNSDADAMMKQNPLSGPEITAITTNKTVYVRYELEADCFTTAAISVTVDNTIPLKLYMQSDGTDVNSGLEENQAVQTFERIEEILVNLAPTTDIEVHIAPGTYPNQEVEWTYLNGRRITFTAKDFSTTRPVFEGNGKELFFVLSARAGVNSYVHFRYLKVQNYVNGIVLYGNRNLPLTGWNGRNYLYGLLLENIGNKFTTNEDAIGIAAIDFFNSRSNTVSNCHFINNENVAPYFSLVHPLYIAHYSMNNIIRNNIFIESSGTAVNIRDSSSYNIAENNYFKNAGKTSPAGDWYCYPATPETVCTKVSGECPSFGNVFRYNEIDGNYHGTIPHAYLELGSDNYCSTLPTKRSIVYGNILHARQGCEVSDLAIESGTLTNYPSFRDTVLFNQAGKITSDGVVKAGERVQFKAGESITFSPGFSVENGAYFLASIADCTPPPTLVTPSSSRKASTPLSVAPKKIGLVLKIQPNPFQSNTMLLLDLPKTEKVFIHLFDQMGRKVQAILNGKLLEKGHHSINLSANKLENGFYFLQMQTATQGVTKKMLVTGK